MRVDKYLKNARFIKRRTLAKEACDAGKIAVNEKVAKPGTEVKVGDKVAMRFGSKEIVIQVTAVSDHVSKDDSKNLYEIVSEKALTE
ncbi:RNA-binding S4 domain-containing protein [Fusibacter sp. JL298sf-3]